MEEGTEDMIADIQLVQDAMKRGLIRPAAKPLFTPQPRLSLQKRTVFVTGVQVTIRGEPHTLKLDEARALLEDLSQVFECQDISEPTRLVMAGAEICGVTIRGFLGRTRSHEVSLVRQCVMFLLYQSGMTLQAIATTLRRRDHATALWGIKRVRRDLVSDAKVQGYIKALSERSKVKESL
jgi:chromosomal replication initiation ATPase DnaA